MKIVISKEAHIRKKELIEAAMQLFQKKGYENTSIDDINKKVGVTKGAFYYHFKSKEDLLEEVAAWLSEKTIKITKDICFDENLNAIDKINKILEKVYEHRIENQNRYKELFKISESETNLLFIKKVWNKVFEKVKEPYLKLIKEGVREGYFKTGYPEEVYEIIMILGDFYRKSIVRLFLDSEEKPQNIKIMKRKAFFLQETLENLLGLPEKSLNVAQQMLKPYKIKPD